MSDEAIQLIAAGIVAAAALVAAVIGVYFVVERRRIGWEVGRRYKYESALGDAIKLMVVREIDDLDKDAIEQADYRETDVAYEFEIALVNTGNRHITDQLNALVEFHPEAAVVAAAVGINGHECNRQWDWDKSRGTHSALLSLQFLNKGEAADILVQTVDNPDERCAVRIEEAGVASWRMDQRRTIFRYSIAGVAGALFVGSWALITLSMWGSGDSDAWDWHILSPALALFFSGQLLFVGARPLGRWLNRVVG